MNFGGDEFNRDSVAACQVRSELVHIRIAIAPPCHVLPTLKPQENS
jgi:hypothetical protein